MLLDKIKNGENKILEFKEKLPSRFKKFAGKIT